MQYIPTVMSWIPTAAKVVSEFAKYGNIANRFASYLPDFLGKVQDKYKTIDDFRRRANRIRDLLAARGRPFAMPLQTNVRGATVLTRAPRTRASARSHASNLNAWGTRTSRRNAYLRAIRAIRRRRAIRAHYANPRTKHRLPQKSSVGGVRQERKVRILKRRLKLRRRLRKRVYRWKKMGKWVLRGNYMTTVPAIGVNDFYAETSLGPIGIVTPSNNGGIAANSVPGGLRSPLGIDAVTSNAANTIWRVMITGNVHFNKQYRSANNSVNDALQMQPVNAFQPNSFTVTDYGELANVGQGASSFYYQASTNASYSVNTQHVRMPPVPVEYFRFTNDTSNPFSVSDSDVSLYAIPYRCYWRKVYFRVNYAIKCAWPTLWGSINTSYGDGLTVRTSPNTVLPPNPPLYVRLFCVRYLGNTSVSASDFCSYVFPNNSPINTALLKGYRQNLWCHDRGIIVWHRLWMFNGQVTPQFQSQENLTDGEEGHFNLGVNYKTSTLTGYPVAAGTGASLANVVYWPTSAQIGSIRFYCFAGFLSPQFTLDLTSSAALDAATVINRVRNALDPSLSVHFDFEAYCYPRTRKQVPYLPQGYLSAANSARNIILTKGYDEWKKMTLEQAEQSAKAAEMTEKEIEQENENDDDPIDLGSAQLHVQPGE